MATKRVFIFGAGFSKAAGMPLATELLPLLSEKVELDEMRGWLDGLAERLAWLDGRNESIGASGLNIEQVFHYATFDIEVQRLKQHMAPVGRRDGPGTPWNFGESIEAWLSYLEDALRDVIFEMDEASNLAPIERWAKTITSDDSVLTFNYDTLAERALQQSGRQWNHGTGRQHDSGIAVLKLHGSIDWIVTHRCEEHSSLELIFEKNNANRNANNTGDVEDDYRLWRCSSREQLKRWISGRDLQMIPHNAISRTVGIAGLGAYKALHQIPGLGPVWARAIRALLEADQVVIVGFAMSDFDAMAQIHFGDCARKRMNEDRPIGVTVVDPFLNGTAKERFRRVFRKVTFIEDKHENVDWSRVID